MNTDKKIIIEMNTNERIYKGKKNIDASHKRLL